MSASDIGMIKTAGGVVGAIATFLWGGADMWLWSLVAFCVIDYISGIAAAYITKTLSSKIGFRGIIKKMLFFAVVAVANILDSGANLGGVLRGAAIGFLIANEGLSILENCGRCGLPIPKKLTDALEQLRNKSEDEPEE